MRWRSCAGQSDDIGTGLDSARRAVERTGTLRVDGMAKIAPVDGGREKMTAHE